jgi:hypothetical protein
MLYRLHTGHNIAQVPQREIVYLVAHAQALVQSGLRCVFTDRHSLARFAAFRDRLDDLGIVDMLIAYAERWQTTAEHPDRQEKKQAEFLVHGQVPWRLIAGIGVLNAAAAAQVDGILERYPQRVQPRVVAQRDWYY